MPTTDELNAELMRVRTQGHTHANSMMALDSRLVGVERRVTSLEEDQLAIRQILVGPGPEEIGGIRGKLAAFKFKVTIIFVLVIFTFGLKVADILGWTSKLQAFVK